MLGYLNVCRCAWDLALIWEMRASGLGGMGGPSWWKDDRCARRRVITEVPQGTRCLRVHTGGTGNVVAAGFNLEST